MVSNSRWSRKIAALLHDPPDKPFGIEQHQERAEELCQMALGRAVAPDEASLAERADHIASAADRVNFPKGSEAYWHSEKAVLIHPLAGRTLDLGLLADVSTAETHQAALEAVRQLMEGETDEKRRFLRLWRQLPDVLAKEFPSVGRLFGMLPADTRQPDHPLMQHLSITAAIADALPQPALLVFSLGPVQEFIAAARRTQDLWMGSYMLSYLTWVALRSIAETYGPDVVLFPVLRGQPLCDLWLSREGLGVKKPDADALTVASLPNKFVALLPSAEAEAAAKMAEQAVQKEWWRLTEGVRTALENGIVPADDEWRRLWQEQVGRQLEIYWIVLPWAGESTSSSKEQAKAVKSLFEQLCSPPTDWQFGKLYALYAKPREEGGGQYDPNWGATYSLLYSLADRAFNARKSLRGFEPTKQKGEKCTICGQRAALHGQDGSRDGVRQFWGLIAKRVQEESQKEDSPFKGHYAALRTPNERGDGRERLCAICTLKRFVQPLYFREELDLRGGFPSTSEVATAAFKQKALLNLSRPELFDTLKTHVELLQMLGFEETVAEGAIPMLWRQLARIPTDARDVARCFLRYDGALLFEETFTTERMQDEYGLNRKDAEAAARRLREMLGKFLEATKEADIPPPAKYYAVLYMDGDRAGQWLSGTHEGLTHLRHVLHPSVRQQLEGNPEWVKLLNEQRLLTPALHAAISDALANFALKLVRFVVEERHAGRVVYAGGDDVLAFLPLDDALLAAQELRALFSGEIAFTDSNLKASEMDVRKKDWQPTFGNLSCTGYLWLDKAPLLTMGPTATASIGIAIAHHLQPLDTTLQAMREAEHAAKEAYGRNALCVHLLKRSGEEARVGAKWSYAGENLDAVKMVNDVCQRFKDGRLAMKLAHAVFEEARTLAELPREAQRAELKRLLKRHSEGRLSREEREAQADELSAKLTAFAAMLDRHAADKYLPRGFMQMAEWLLLARFLAKGGEE